MQLFHFTEPSIYLHIAYQGLLPHCKELNAPMTNGVPVVWLTRETSNIVTTAYLAEVVKLCREPLERKVGEPVYGGTARLTVHLDRADRKLVRYADFLHETGSAAILKRCHGRHAHHGGFIAARFRRTRSSRSMSRLCSHASTGTSRRSLTWKPPRSLWQSERRSKNCQRIRASI